MLKLTALQQSLHFKEQLSNGRANNIGGYLEIDCPVDLDVFSAARSAVLASNDAFQLTLQKTGELAELVRSKQHLPDLNCLDFSNSDTPFEAAIQWIERDFEKGLLFEQRFLFDDCLIRIRENLFLYYGKANHLVMDGWGFSLWGQRLVAAYQSMLKGDALLDDALDFPQFADFLMQVDSDSSAQRLKKAEQYWLSQYQTIPEALWEPRFDRGNHGESEACRHSIRIPPDRYRSIAETARSCKSGILPLFLSVTYVLFSRITQKTDLSVGMPVHNRSTAALKQIVGSLMNVIASRLCFEPDLSFDALLKAVSGVLRQDLKHQSYPLSALSRELGLLAQGRSNPYELSFNYQKLDFDLQLDGRPVSAHYLNSGFDDTPLILTLCEYGEDQDVWLHFDYQSSYWCRQEIEQIAQSFEHVLQQVLKDTDRPIAEYLLVDAECQATLIELNRGSHNPDFYDFDICSCLEQMAADRPDSDAVISGSDRLTYAQLIEKVSATVNGLRRSGCQDGTRIGIGFNRSIDQVVSLLATLRIGGVFVPLLPGTPQARLEYMVQDAGVDVVLTSPEDLSQYQCLSCRSLVLGDVQSSAVVYTGMAGAELTQPGSGDTAYILYTSGSTGQPKGVSVGRGSLSNLLLGMDYQVSFPDSLRWLSVTNSSFDISILEVLLPLVRGGLLVLATTDEATSGNSLIELINAHDINVMQATPAGWSMLLGAGWSGSSSLCALCGGEALSLDLAQRLASHVNALWNCYGPTEATIWSMVQPVSVGAKEIVLDGSLPNYQHLVLDSSGQLVPPGAVGELHIGGIGLAQHYQSRPQLTEQKFILHPYCERSQERLYKTGDLVRLRADGGFDFLGRIDDQVKVNGHRVEPAEIENVLGSCDGVKQIVVVCRSGGHHNSVLAAVIVPEGELAEHQVLANLEVVSAQRLPEYMRPKIWRFRDSLPLTSSAKVDRKALVDELKQVGVSASETVLPETELQAQVLKIWEQLFDRTPLGITDNFFELGGHSLLATRLVSQLRQVLSVEVSLKQVFSHPTIVALCKVVEQSTASQLPELTVSNEPAQASHAQQRLWFIDQLEGGSAQYNMPSAFEFKGELDESALIRSLESIVSRHSVLRTRFVKSSDSDELTLAVDEDVSIPLTHLDLSELSESDRMTVIRERYQEEISRPFALDQDVLLRVQLLRCEASRHVVLFNMHHIASDGWSVGVLVREFCALYEAYSQGQANPLPPLKVQYSDYAHWQQRWLSDQVLEEELGYWRDQLSDLPVVHSVPLDHARPTEQGFGGAVHRRLLDGSLVQGLKGLCRDQDVTLFMALQSAFAVLLSRYSGSSDIVMGTPIAGRTHESVEGLIGLFVNTLVLRSDVDLEQSFEGLLRENRERVLGAYSHQHLPFEMLVEALKPERSLSHSPLFQIMFSMNTAEQVALRLPGLSLLELELTEEEVHQFDLSLDVSETENGLLCQWSYDTALFLPESVERFAASFESLLTDVVSSPQQQIGRISLVSDSERRLLTEVCSGTKRAYPQDRCIHHLIEAQAAKDENAVAVIFEGESLSYGELNHRSNQLAHYLIDQGVSLESLVGISMERSLELVIGIVAILKAGGAYVPLDPDHPSSRLQQILDDSSVSWVLTQSHLESAQLDHALCLDQPDLQAELAGYSNQNPVLAHTSNQLAYVIYTSGSTGLPKGVQVEHRSVLNHANWLQNRFGLNHDDRILQKNPYSFDVSVWEIFWPLIQGAQLVLARPGGHKDPDYLVDLIVEQQISYLDFVPSMLSALMSISDWSRCSSVKQVFCGGEALSRELVKQFYQTGTQAVLNNMYGPTEATIDASSRRCDAGEDQSSVPIGRPIDNAQLYVVNSHLQLQPIGGVGELLIGGVGLARGYLNRPELTAERFIPNPFSDDPQSRVYRTGDLARWLPSGELEFLGRLDHQVKLRGFRIELGEIESHLKSLDSITDAAVMAIDQELVSYVVAAQSSPEEDWLTGCREALRAVLPEYMVPASWVVLPELPLSSNGKLDRKALPAPSASDRQSQAYVAPRTELEGQLCEVWLSLLPVDQVGIHDNFFELGGHSLLATRLVSQLRRMLSVEVSLKQVFSHPTVAELASVIAEAERSQLPELSVSDQPPQPSHAQQRLWFIDQLEGGSAQYNMPSAFELLGELDEAALEQSLNSVLSRHTVLRTRFIKSSDRDELVLTVDEDVSVPLTYLDLSTLGESEQLEVIRERYQEEISRPFALDQDVLLRVQLLRCEASRHVVLFNMHHIASDGWSVGVLVREFCALYEAYSQGQANPLPPLKVQYSDYAHWQQRWLSDQVLEEELGYWRDQLSDLPVVHSVPLDHARPTEQGFGGAVHRRLLDGSLVQGLKGLCRDQDVTLFMALQSAFAVLLSRYSGSSDIVMGTPIAGRTHESVEGLIGLFVNTLVLRSDVDLGESFEGLLRENRERVLGAYSHQHLPFEMLVEALKPERSLSHSPLFQIMFSMNNTEKVDLSLPGLELRSLEGGVDQSIKFDLSLEVNESEGGLSCHWSYSTDLFLHDTIERFAGNFEILLKALLASPAEPMKHLKPLCPIELQRMLVDWNSVDNQSPREICIHELFEEQAAAKPDAVALVCGNHRLSYQQLNSRANQLAHYLSEHGVGPESLVGLFMSRSPEMVVGLLGILKAGAAYLPLDPGYPQVRLNQMIEDSGLQLILTDHSHTEQLDVEHQFCLSSKQEELSSYSAADPSLPANPDQLAYVIYTSGSTGKPKGAMAHHRSVIRLVHGCAEYLGSLDTLTCIQAAPVSFDAATFEIWMPLLSGGELVLYDEDQLDLGHFNHLVKRHQVNLAWLTAGLFDLWVETEASANTPLKVLFTGGDVVSPASVNTLYAKNPRINVINGYGPTENVTFTCCHEIPRALDVRQSIPIGKPIQGTELFVLSRHKQPVPQGAIGELYIGGSGLVRGYLNKPELTAEKFVERVLPGSKTPQRLYRSGDLVRWRADGCMEFFGRSDLQVKIRGFRIEPGEIEARLVEHPQVHSGSVTVVESDERSKLLVAYVVPVADSKAAKQAKSSKQALDALLIQHLKNVLPVYMLPSHFEYLDEMPLTANGKVDRSRLPQPDYKAGNQAEYVSPRNEVETRLCQLWQEMLGLERVGVRDNFFDLGGHSLMAMTMIGRVKADFDCVVSVKELFESQTVAELAELIETKRWLADCSEVFRATDTREQVEMESLEL